MNYLVKMSRNEKTAEKQTRYRKPFIKYFAGEFKNLGLTGEHLPEKGMEKRNQVAPGLLPQWPETVSCCILAPFLLGKNE